MIFALVSVVSHNIHPVSALPQRLNNSIFILILHSCIVNLIISTQLDVSGVRRGQQRIAVTALVRLCCVASQDARHCQASLAENWELGKTATSARLIR